MTNYSLGKIYKIVCNTTGLVYYGSTCEPTLARRLAGHVSKCKCWNENQKGHFVSSFEVLKNDTYIIVLVELAPSNDKMGLLQRERFFIENNECVNKQTPAMTKKEIYEKYDKVEINHLRKLERLKDWYSKNREKMAQYRLENRKKQSDYYVKNKEHLNKKSALYWAKNKDKFKEQDIARRLKNKENKKMYDKALRLKQKELKSAEQTEALNEELV